MPLGLTVPIRGDAANLDKTLKGASGSVLGFGGDVAGLATSVLPLAAAAGGVAIALSEMTNAAAEDQAQQAKLAAAIKSATGSTDDYTAATDAAIAAGQDKAFTDDQTRAALMSLVTATGDVNAATALLGPTMDIARFAGVDLATAADAVAKAQAGQDTALTRMLPGLEKGATATDTLANAQALAAGQADAFASSTAGAQAKASDSFKELGETIGSALLPALDALLPAITPMIQALGTLITAILPLIIPLLKLLGAALGIVASAITTVVGWLTQLVTWLRKGIDLVASLLGKLGPLKDLAGVVGGIVGGIGGLAATGPTTYGATPTSSSGGSGGIVFNITATGDSLATEAAVARALRRVNRLNGGGPAWSI